MPITSGLMVLLFISLITPAAGFLGLLDEPSDRKTHIGSVPMVGGFAIHLTLLATISVIMLPPAINWIITVGTILVILGCLDDALGLSVATRLFVQLVTASLVLAGSHLSIKSLGIEWLGFDSLGLLGIVITLIGVVGLSNAFNMSDGIDGLAAGHFLIALLLISVAMMATLGEVWNAELMVCLFSPVFAFWLVNIGKTPLKPVFLGDAGSYYLGFIAAWILIYFSQSSVAKIEPIAALWCVTVPTWDTLAVVFRRVRLGRSPFRPGRDHFHHFLVDSGVSSASALGVTLAISFVLGVVGIIVTYLISPVTSLIAYVGMFFVFFYVSRMPFATKVFQKVS